MAEYDQNIQLDSEFTYQQYVSTLPSFLNQTFEGGTSVVTTINGVDGPAINFDGGTTGYQFSTGANPITLSGAANSIRESSGPTVLTFGSIAIGDFLKRVGSTIVGDPSPASPALNEVTTAVDLVLSDANDVVFVNTVAGPVTITLHNPTTAKQKYYDIKLIVAGNNMTIDGNGANIDGAATLVSGVQYISLTLVPDNASGAWFIV